MQRPRVGGVDGEERGPHSRAAQLGASPGASELCRSRGRATAGARRAPPCSRRVGVSMASIPPTTSSPSQATSQSPRVRVRRSPETGLASTRRSPLRRARRGGRRTPPRGRRGPRRRRRPAEGDDDDPGGPVRMPRGGRRGRARAGGRRAVCSKPRRSNSSSAARSLSCVQTPRLPRPVRPTAATSSAARASHGTEQEPRSVPSRGAPGATICSATIPAGGSSTQQSP